MILVLVGFVVLLGLLFMLVRVVDRQQRKKWGDAPKQQPGSPSSGESTTAWHSGRSDSGF